jgi:hypothetical protein
MSLLVAFRVFGKSRCGREHVVFFAGASPQKNTTCTPKPQRFPESLAVAVWQAETARLLELYCLCLTPVVPNRLLFEKVFSYKDKVKNH